MNRRAWLIGAALPLLGPPLRAAARAESAVLDRLVGTWRSDRAVTMKHWFAPGAVTPAQASRVAGFFGHVTHHYTRTHLTVDFPGAAQPVRLPFSLIGFTDNSATLALPDEAQHTVFFTEAGYFIRSGGGFEHFARVVAG